MKEEGIDRWVVRGVFRAVVKGVSLTKSGKSGGFKCIPQCTC